MRGHLLGYEWVWFYPGGIANILSMSRLRERYSVTFDSAMDNCFHVHKSDGKSLRFQEASRRLYYVDTMNRDKEGTMLINTVDKNKSKMSVLDLTQAKRARVLQRRIGRQATRDYIYYVSTNMIPNCPVTVQDVRNAEFIRGRDLGCVKEKTVRQISPKVEVENTSIPVSIMQQYKNTTLLVDIMSVY